jgi:hypothetical protein
MYHHRDAAAKVYYLGTEKGETRPAQRVAYSRKAAVKPQGRPWRNGVVIGGNTMALCEGSVRNKQACHAQLTCFSSSTPAAARDVSGDGLNLVS